MLLPVINMTWCCRKMCWVVLVKCSVQNGFDNFSWSSYVGGAGCADQEQSCTPAKHQKPGKAPDARSGRAGEPIHQSSGKLTPTWIFRQKFAGLCLQTRLCLQPVIRLLVSAVQALHYVSRALFVHLKGLICRLDIKLTLFLITKHLCQDDCKRYWIAESTCNKMQFELQVL